MKIKAASPLLHIVVTMHLVISCGPDTPTVISSCPNGESKQVEVWRDRAVLVPRTSTELLPASLWQGISPMMSRTQVEALLATHLQSRQPYWSEFATPLGKLRWSLDREASGGDEVQIPRVYLYPKQLSLKDILDPGTLECLRKAAPKAKYLIVRRGDGQGQLATLEVAGLIIRTVIWEQTRA